LIAAALLLYYKVVSLHKVIIKFLIILQLQNPRDNLNEKSVMQRFGVPEAYWQERDNGGTLALLHRPNETEASL